ncbi:MAG: hypothetical protein ACR2NF_05920, partial [Pirellulales bacterium]
FNLDCHGTFGLELSGFSRKSTHITPRGLVNACDSRDSEQVAGKVATPMRFSASITIFMA